MIELVKAPANAADSGSEFSSLRIDIVLGENEFGNYILPAGSNFSFVTSGHGTLSGTTPTDFVSSFVDDLVFGELIPYLQGILDEYYTITMPTGGPTGATLLLTAINPGSANNFLSTTLPSGFTVIENISASDAFIHPVFTGNDYDYVLQTDEYIATNEVVGRVDILLIGKPLPAQLFTLSNGVKTLPFIFTSNPTTAQTERYRLLAHGSGDSNLVQAQSIIAGLNRDIYFKTNYTAVVHNVSGTNITIRIAPRSSNVPALNLTSTPSNISVVSGSLVASVPVAYAANYRMLVDVWGLINNEDKLLLSLDGIPNDAQQSNFRDISRAFHDIIEFGIPNYGTVGHAYLHNYLKYYLVAADYYGNPAVDYPAVRMPADKYFIALPGAAANSAITDNYLLSYFGSPAKWLTAMQQSSAVFAPSTKQWLSAFLPIEENLTIGVRVKMYYSDGTNSTATAYTFTGEALSIVTIAVGYNQLGINSIKEPDKTVNKYEVTLMNASTPITEVFSIKLDRTYYRNSRTFIYRNSFGQLESLWIRGAQSTEVNYEAEMIDFNYGSRDEVAGIKHGNKLENNITFNETFKLASGTRAKTDLHLVKGFFASKHKFIDLNNCYCRIVTGKQKIDLGNDNDTLFTFDFTYMLAQEERGNA